MRRLGILLIVAMAHASHGAIDPVGGGPRFDPLDVTNQVILPSLPRNPYWFELSATPGGTPAEYSYTERYKDVDIHWSDLVYTNTQIDAQMRGDIQQVTLELDTNAASTITASGLITYNQEDYSVTVTGTGKGLERSITVQYTVYTNNPSVNSNTYECIGGTFLSNINAEATALIDTYGYTTNSRQMFLDDPSGSPFDWHAPATTGTITWREEHPEFSFLFSLPQPRTLIRNTNSILGSMDVSGIPMWNNAEPFYYLKNWHPGALVTERHLLVASHPSSWPAGVDIVFMGMNGELHTNEIAQSAIISGSDIQLIRLTSEVPAYIAPVKVLPTNWDDYTGVFDDAGGGYKICNYIRQRCFFMDQMRVVSASYMRNYSATAESLDNTWDETYPNLGRDKDSGSPIFFVCNGQMVVLETFNVYAGGPDIVNYHDDINAQIALWGDTNRLYDLDMSMFTNYTE